MKYLDGTEKTLLGVNIGVLGFGVSFILLVYGLLTTLLKSRIKP
ncbi:hypothetical protein [Changchengzhania lutea]|nr:hypothetical protein [Changchengzhania lutea]